MVGCKLGEVRRNKVAICFRPQVKILKGFPRQGRGLRMLLELNKNPKHQSQAEVGLENCLI